MNCPKCGGFCRRCVADVTVAHRLNGTQCQSRFTWLACVKCGYTTPRQTSTLAFWQAEAQAGRATMLE